MTEIKNSAKNWNQLPGAHGEYFIVQDNLIAGTQANRLNFWRNGEHISESFSAWSSSGYPQCQGDEIFWNDLRLNIRTGTSHKTGMLANDDGFRPVTSCWSPDGNLLLISFENTRNNSQPGSRSILLDREFKIKRVLVSGFDFAPNAACFGNKWLALGTRGPSILDFEGNLIVKLEGDLLPQRIRFADNESLLFVQTFEAITIWDVTTWKIKTQLKGPWLNAAIDSDAKRIYAIDFEGALFFAEISNIKESLRKIPTPSPMATIDAGKEILLASFARGTPIGWILKNEINEFSEPVTLNNI